MSILISHLERETRALREFLVNEEISNSTDDYVNIISDKSIKVLTDMDREVFTSLSIVILIISVILNLMAMATVSRRNYRFFQKTYIISLAISDLLTVVSFSTNNLATFSQPYINWTLGSFLCHFLPMAQALGVFSSSMALLLIAMDRYRTIVKAMNKRWDPRKMYCISGCFLGWVICACLSVPMYVYYTNEMVLVIFLDKNGNIPADYKQEELHMCVAVDKEPLRNSYIIMIIFVFAPLLIVFFWFYYSIAQLIWRHRKPVEAVPESKTETSTTETTLAKTHENIKKEVVTNNKNEQMKKKLRTFKIILVLITTFVICRLPFWAFTTIKLSYVVKGFAVWRINYSISALNLASTILNPLLYTYLNVTVRVVSKIVNALTAFLCCFFSDEEFVEFEKRNVIQEEKNVKVIQMKKY
ncbi:neuropeptide Y receptor type 2 [Coccinella septempunctata]|uniref:neuropeptide Y receptor type 2 n=1 Tax=Coccinella septempunctata TaxID=41139 RepID=UPI001D0634ED|nr:neuropeptide Y receptor type 2 [Coccinella septempunctata]